MVCIFCIRLYLSYILIKFIQKVNIYSVIKDIL